MAPGREKAVGRVLVDVAGGGTAPAVRVRRAADLVPALGALGVRAPRPVVVVVGGAGGLSPGEGRTLARLFEDGVAAAVEEVGAAAVDGGTDAGVMAALGEARARRGSGFPLVGVAAEGTVRSSHPHPASHAAELEPHHSGFLLVPGSDWGDEAPWIAQAATALAAGGPSVTVVVNGGDVALDDARHSLEAGRPVLAVRGTGRAADELAAAARGEAADARAEELARSGLVTTVDADDPEAVFRVLVAMLGPVHGANHSNHLRHSTLPVRSDASNEDAAG